MILKVSSNLNDSLILWSASSLRNISPVIYTDKYYNTVQPCSSATDGNLTETVLDILRDLGILSVFPKHTNTFHSTQAKRIVLLTLIFNGLISISEVQFIGPSISY